MRTAIIGAAAVLGLACGGAPEATAPTVPVEVATDARASDAVRTLAGAALIDTSRAADAAGKPGGGGATSDVLDPGTVVRVVNPDTGQSVIVVIDGRADDASEPAHVRLAPEDALRIGMADDRPMLVRLEVLRAPTGN